MAEGIFKKLIIDNKLENKIYCDSAGTSNYHIGYEPDKRMQSTAMKHGIKLEHFARQLCNDDFSTYNYIIAMDSSNFEDIKILANSDNNNYQLLMMLDFDKEAISTNVPDPYYGGSQGFEKVYQMLLRSCNEFLKYLKTTHNL